MSTAYRELGASSSKAGVHAALRSAGFDESSNLFAGVFPDSAGDPQYRSFLHCDGAGTKSIVAYLLARATGELRWYRSLAQDAVVMNIDDVFCLGPVEGLMLSNLVARNAHLVPDGALTELLQGYQEVAAALRTAGIALTLSGGETADCGDVVRTLLVDAVLTGRILAEKLVRTDRIVPGDLIVGLSSTGKATYETKASSGIGSNGLTLARHALISEASVSSFPEAVDPALSAGRRYRGPFSVTDTVESLGTTVGEALLSPTRTYAPVLSALFGEGGVEIHAAIHNTGGGQTKVLRFGKGCRYVKDQLFPVPPLFALLQEHGGIPWREMYEVFNMGHRMEVYVPADHAQKVITAAARFGIEAQVVGRVEASSAPEGGNEVVVESAVGSFTYRLNG